MERTVINEDFRQKRLSEYRILLEVIMPKDEKVPYTGKDGSNTEQSQVV